MAEVTDRLTVTVTVSQPDLQVTGCSELIPSASALIAFGMWMKGDKGDKGDPGTAEYGTTAYWNTRIGYVPAEGSIIVYTDKATKEVDGQTVNIPGIKIGSGNGYVQDLAFVGDETAAALLSHMEDSEAHITQAERELWNRKINVDDLQEIVGETLVFNRN